jgi:hypothetical protein
LVVNKKTRCGWSKQGTFPNATPQRARLMPFALQRYENTFENANVFENIFVFVIENALICAIKTKNPLKTYGKAL